MEKAIHTGRYNKNYRVPIKLKKTLLHTKFMIAIFTISLQEHLCWKPDYLPFFFFYYLPFLTKYNFYLKQLTNYGFLDLSI